MPASSRQKTAGQNQRGEVVCEFTRTILIPKRDAAHLEAAANY